MTKIILVPVNVLYDSHMCAILFILQRTSINKRERENESERQRETETETQRETDRERE